jgi:hypothetical protein
VVTEESRLLRCNAVWLNVLQLLVTANIVPSQLILVTLMMVAILSSETSVLTRTTRLNIKEDGILPSCCREKLKAYNIIQGMLGIYEEAGLARVYTGWPPGRICCLCGH